MNEQQPVLTDREIAEFDAATWGAETILRIEANRLHGWTTYGDPADPFGVDYVVRAARIAARRAFAARPELA